MEQRKEDDDSSSQTSQDDTDAYVLVPSPTTDAKATKHEEETPDIHQVRVGNKQLATHTQHHAEILITATTGIQHLSPFKWIDDLEQYQHVADRMEYVNQENKDDRERHNLKRETGEACLTAIREDLAIFCQEHPKHNTYETWIKQLHPENANKENNTIDHRFYLHESHHRKIWNASLSPTSTSRWNWFHTTTRKPVSAQTVAATATATAATTT